MLIFNRNNFNYHNFNVVVPLEQLVAYLRYSQCSQGFHRKDGGSVTFQGSLGTPLCLAEAFLPGLVGVCNYVLGIPFLIRFLEFIVVGEGWYPLVLFLRVPLPFPNLLLPFCLQIDLTVIHPYVLPNEEHYLHLLHTRH